MLSLMKKMHTTVDRFYSFLYCCLSIIVQYNNSAVPILYFVDRLVDIRSFAFVVARALVTEIKKLREDGANGQLQADDLLSFFTGSQVEVHKSELLL